MGAIPARDDDHGLRHVAQRYPNALIARAMKMSECAVRKWLRRAGVERVGRPPRVQMTGELMQDIRRHLLGGRRPGGPDDYLLADERGCLPWPKHVGVAFQRIIRQANVRRICVHDLRHSFGSIWAQRVPVPLLTEMMGHASIKTTERYIHVTGEMLRLGVTQALADIEQGKAEEG